MKKRKDTEDLSARLDEFAQMQNMATETLLQELWQLFHALDTDWNVHCENLEKTLSLFLLHTKYTKEEMKLVCLTVLNWRQRMEAISRHKAIIHGLNGFLDTSEDGLMN